MGIYLNPDSSKFEEAVNSDIYIDKTGLLTYTNSVLHTMQKYICISRPRRFGKSLNMDMLKAFFEIGTDKRLFDGLEMNGTAFSENIKKIKKLRKNISIS